MRKKGISETAKLKDEIQGWVRLIVIARDGGCIFRDSGWHVCNGYREDGELILQADHLISRANSATYADTRLIVCVCKGLHGWKRWNEKEYDARVRTILPAERIALWDKAQAARYKPVRMGVSDWKKEIASLKSELAVLT